MVGRHRRPPARHPRPARAARASTPAGGSPPWSTIVAAASMAGVPLAVRLRRPRRPATRRSCTSSGCGWLGVLLAGRRRLGAHRRLQRRFVWAHSVGSPSRVGPALGTPMTRAAPPRVSFVVPARAARRCDRGVRRRAGAARRRRRRGGRRPLDARLDDVHLALWHGFNLPLALSALALVGGPSLFALPPAAIAPSLAPAAATERVVRTSTSSRCAASTCVANRVTARRAERLAADLPRRDHC